MFLIFTQKYFIPVYLQVNKIYQSAKLTGVCRDYIIILDKNLI